MDDSAPDSDRIPNLAGSSDMLSNLNRQEHAERAWQTLSLPVAGQSGVSTVVNDSASGTPAQNDDSNSKNFDRDANAEMSEEAVQQDAAEENRSGSPMKVDPPSDVAGEETCPLCFDVLGRTEDHRLVALKCGHLFGSKCIKQSLQVQNVDERSCPTCKRKANLEDVRPIYARRLVAVDTSQVTNLQRRMEAMEAEKRKTALEMRKVELARRACELQLEILKSSLKKSQNTSQPPLRNYRFAMETNLAICEDASSKTLAYASGTNDIYVTVKSTDTSIPGYGVRNVNCADSQLGPFIHLHRDPMRDISYAPSTDFLLTASLDKTARVVHRGVPIMSVDTGVPLWSCTWDCMRSNQFYVGGTRGVIHQYDIRNTSAYVQVFASTGDLTPVVSICSTEFGLMSCQFNSSKHWVPGVMDWEQKPLPVPGSIMSLCYDSDCSRVLVFARPRSVGYNERSRLILCKVDPNVTKGEVLFEVEDRLSDSTALTTRPGFIKAPGARWIAAHSDSDSTMYMFGIDGTSTLTLPPADPALGVCTVPCNGSIIMGALSESRLRLYKAYPID